MAKLKGQKEFPWTTATIRECKRLKANGWTWDQIGSKLGISGNAVHKAVARARV